MKKNDSGWIGMGLIIAPLAIAAIVIGVLVIAVALAI